MCRRLNAVVLWGRASRGTRGSFFFLACAWPAVAVADTFDATRTTGLSERSHHIALRRARPCRAGRATLRPQHGFAQRPGNVADRPAPGRRGYGLRTRSVGPGPVRWFAGDLLEAEAAAHRYEEPTGVGGDYPKDPALLSWRTQQLLALQVFPCPAHSEEVVEYTHPDAGRVPRALGRWSGARLARIS